MSQKQRDQELRCFIAIELDLAIKDLLRNIQERLGKCNAPLRLVKPEGIHLTLKFLGEIQQVLVERISGVLAQIMPQFSPFRLSLNEVGAFPHPGKARVLWIGIDQGREQLVALQKHIEHELDSRLKIGREKRAFSPHLTLARLKYPSPVDHLFPEIVKDKQLFSLTMPVHCIKLFQSILRPSGAEYTVLETFTFSGMN
ncbi:RNA 2',3'-cyclic phosphodiesterase [bacterium]|nr:RNA 2',3'-cyclic phosphodiesterase [bacterium]